MKGKVMRWDEFREMCKEDAYNWNASGWKADEIGTDDIINEYDDEYFSDDESTEYDDLSRFFTPAEVAAQTLEYLAEIENAE